MPSAREAKAQTQSRERLHEQRAAFRPIGIVIIVAVVVSASSQSPGLGLHGRSLWVTLSLVVFGLALVWVIRDPGDRSLAPQAAAILVIGAAGVALSALQPHGATELAAGAAVFLAAARLPPLLAGVIAVGVTAALVATVAVAGGGAAAVIATTLLCAMLFLVAWFVRLARAGQDRSELLLAQLEDAREAQTAAAALEERSRIAGELHDVLAHSLSAAAIQLQGARVLAEREGAGGKVVYEAIERASDLVRDGLRDARSAVGALRGDPLPGVAQLHGLVAGFRSDVGAPVTLKVEGAEHALSADAGLALYRGAQEALTNVARYAPGAVTSVTLCYTDLAATLTVENADAASDATEAGLVGVGGGRGLEGMRERIERLGGTMRAGPIEDGWRVQLEVPF